VNGVAQSGSATIETLRKRGIAYFCPLDENGTATSLAPVIPTGDGTMDFSIATGDDTGLLVFLEDI
jgi:hypothetical protein